MSTRRWSERVEDILDAIDEVETFVSGMELETFRADFKTVRAVELNLIIIGEAASRIPDDIQTAYPDIPWSFMKAMRNRLVHAYFNVDRRILWDTVQDDLPPLKAALQMIASNPPEDPEPGFDDLPRG
jgi:uncharacterized protein with HEPN domain